MDRAVYDADQTMNLVPSAVLYRDLHQQPPDLLEARANCYHLLGQEIFDASGGAAVAGLGHYDPDGKTTLSPENMNRIVKAMVDQIYTCFYYPGMTFKHSANELFAQELVQGTNGNMTLAGTYSNGGDAVAACMKLAIQYFQELPEPQPGRVKFIARKQSYHGTTLDVLSLGHHASRRARFEDSFKQENYHHISPCNPYRGRRKGQSDKEYVAELANELEKKILELGQDTVAAFVMEPMVGAALCAPPLPGYMAAMRDVCRKYDVLLVADEVMCGMGRTGKLHAWQHENVVPDLQAVGKVLGAGILPISAMLVGRNVHKVLYENSGAFAHGHTFQGHPVVCRVGLEVQQIIRKENLVENVEKMGKVLGQKLMDRISPLPHVGDVRGMGLFWGIEFVKNKATKVSFPRKEQVVEGFHQLALERHSIFVYSCTGWGENGIDGDGIIIAPPYHVTEDDINTIVESVAGAIEEYFEPSRPRL